MTEYERGMGLLTEFLNQLKSLQDVWIPFLLAVAIVGIVVWKFSTSRNAEIVNTLEHRLKLRDDTIARYEREEKRPPQQHQAPVIGPTSPPSPPKESDENPEMRTFVQSSITPEFFRSLFKDKTDLQAKRLAQPYFGLWMSVSVTVTSVMEMDDCIMVQGYDGPKKSVIERMMAAVWMRFYGDTGSVEILRDGDRIQVVGQIKSIETFSVTLNKCELIKAE